MTGREKLKHFRFSVYVKRESKLLNKCNKGINSLMTENKIFEQFFSIFASKKPITGLIEYSSTR